ncbi:MAG TPA: trehalose-phosphatase [Gaiellaceae bacterium]|nr:trehalose-phosphatase [Gaiellaceae bacterium]
MAATDALERLAAEPARSGLFLDFDGVLAPIVARPEQAAVPEETRRELARLALRYGLVAVVSGRAGEDVAARVGLDGLVYVGSHGLELTPQAERWRSTLAAFAADAPWPAEQLELKGLSLAFHYRDREDEAEAVQELERVAEAAREDGLVARFGRRILEVLPPVGSNKGTAVRELLERHGLTQALAAGDDVTDLDSFAALDGLEVAVRVAVVDPESPALLRESADVVLDSPAEFVELLRKL